MKAPPDTAAPRDRDAILAEAVKLIDPPKDSVEAFRAQLTARLNAARRTHKKTANIPPPGEMKDRAVAHLKALHAVKKTAAALKSFGPGETDDFNEALKREIHWAGAIADGLVVPPGSPPPNAAAHTAAFVARDLIDPNPYRHPENIQIADKNVGGGRVHRAFTMKGELVRPGRQLAPDEVLAIPVANRGALIKSGYLEVFSAVETCPWRRRATLTRGGAWLKLASLIFEDVTGTRGRDMMEDCRKVDEQQPRYIVRLRSQASS